MTHLPQNPGYWLNPENGELGKISDNYIYSVAEAKKLASAAGFSEPIPLPYYVALSDGEVPEADGLVMDSLSATGVFKLEITRVNTRQEHNRYRIQGQYDGLIPLSGSSDDADYFVMRDYHSKGRVDGPQAYPDPRVDALGEAQRQEVDIEKRRQILKDFQILVGELMPAVPGRHLYTNFTFRWPWLHNSAYGEGGSPPAGNPIQGGHLHWLDKDMPNRDTPL
jgi:ABC-type transport system substrate-binding protein